MGITRKRSLQKGSTSCIIYFKLKTMSCVFSAYLSFFVNEQAHD